MVLYDARMKRMKRWTATAIGLGSFVIFIASCNRETTEPPPETMATPIPPVAEQSTPPPPPPEAPPAPPEKPPSVSGRTRPESTAVRSRAYGTRTPARGPKPASAVTIPSTVVAGNKIVNAGSYDVRLDPAEGGMSITLLQNGVVVASELAVQPVRQPSHEANGAWLWHDSRQESMYRVYYQSGRSLWFATFPTQP